MLTGSIINMVQAAVAQFFSEKGVEPDSIAMNGATYEFFRAEVSGWIYSHAVGDLTQFDGIPINTNGMLPDGVVSLGHSLLGSERMLAQFEFPEANGIQYRIMMRQDESAVIEMLNDLHTPLNNMVVTAQRPEAFQRYITGRESPAQVFVAEAFGAGVTPSNLVYLNGKVKGAPTSIEGWARAADVPREVIGFVHVAMHQEAPFILDEYSCEVCDLYVKPEWRRSGVAATLMAMGEAWGQRWSSDYTELYVHADNEAAQNFYIAQGYQTSHFVMTKGSPS